jgi:hypothetical protein
VLIRQPDEAFEAPVSIMESIPGLTRGYDATGYSIGHLNTAYRLTCSEPSLLSELRGIALRLDEAMEVVDNASVVATYRANLERRIRAGIVAKATLANGGHPPDPRSVELAYQRHFATVVPKVVATAAAVLGKHPVADPDAPAVAALDDEDAADPSEDVTEAAGAAGVVPKYTFGRLNPDWKPQRPSDVDRFARRADLMQRMHDLWSQGAKRGNPEWDSLVRDLQATETLAERRARYLSQMDRIAKATATGRTVNARGEPYTAVADRVRARIKRAQQAMRDKGIEYQSASSKATSAPEQEEAPESTEGADMKIVDTAPDEAPAPEPAVKESLAAFLRLAEARLEEHPGNHDQRVHSPSGRAAIAGEKGGGSGATTGGAKGRGAAPKGGGGGGEIELSDRDKAQVRRLKNQLAGRNADDDGDGKYKPPARAQTTVAKAPKAANGGGSGATTGGAKGRGAAPKATLRSILSNAKAKLTAKYAKFGGNAEVSRLLSHMASTSSYARRQQRAERGAQAMGDAFDWLASRKG